MLSEEQAKKMVEAGEPAWFNKRTLTVASLCLLTAIFGGLTVWSINGMYTATYNYVAGHPESGTYQVLSPVNPTVQGILAFLTLIMLFASLVLIIKRK